MAVNDSFIPFPSLLAVISRICVLIRAPVTCNGALFSMSYHRRRHPVKRRHQDPFLIYFHVEFTQPQWCLYGCMFERAWSLFQNSRPLNLRPPPDQPPLSITAGARQGLPWPPLPASPGSAPLLPPLRQPHGAWDHL